MTYSTPKTSGSTHECKECYLKSSPLATIHIFQLCHILFYKLKVKTFLQRSTWLQLLQVSSHVCPPCIFGTETSFLHSMLSTFLGHRQEYMVLTAWVCFSSSLFSVSRSILWGGAVNCSWGMLACSFLNPVLQSRFNILGVSFHYLHSLTPILTIRISHCIWNWQHLGVPAAEQQILANFSNRIQNGSKLVI